MRMARLIAGRVEAVQPRPRSGRGQQRHLTVLMRQRPRREPAGKPRRDIVTEDESRQHFAAGAAACSPTASTPGKTCIAA